MTKSTVVKKTRRVNNKAPRFIEVHATIIAMSGAFAVASTIGLMLTMYALPFPAWVKVILMGLGAVMAMSVALAPILAAPAWGRAGIIGQIIGLPLIAMLMVIDGGLQVNAVKAVETVYVGEQVKAAQEVVTLAKAEVATVQGKIDALPSAVTACEGLGPQNCAARLAGIEAERKILMDDRTAKETKVTEAETKVEAARNGFGLPLNVLSAIMTCFQVSTFFIRAWLSGVTARIERLGKEERKAEREATAKRKAEREAKNTTARAEKEPEVEPAQWGPRLVYSNDN